MTDNAASPWLSETASDSQLYQQSSLAGIPTSASAPLPYHPPKPSRKPVLEELVSGTFWTLNSRFWGNPEEFKSRLRVVNPFDSPFGDATQPQLLLHVGEDLPELPYLAATRGNMLLRVEFWRSLNKMKNIFDDHNRNKTATRAILHIGHPGIGKSVWLLFALVWNLIHGTSVVFNRVRFEPWKKYKAAKLIVMNGWDPSEILVGSLLHDAFRPFVQQNKLPELAVLLHRRFDRCGPVARHLFWDRATYEDAVRAKTQVLENLKFETLENMITSPAEQMGESHGLILMSRRTPDTEELGSDVPICSILNRWTMDLLFSRYMLKSIDRLRRFGTLLSSHTGYSSSLGWLFESYVHRYLADPSFRGDTPLLMKKMRRDGANFVPDPNSAPIIISLPERRITIFTTKSDFRNTADHTKYFVPAATNNPAYDSFFYFDVDAISASTDLPAGLHGCASQATIAATHTCKKPGMVDVSGRFHHADVAFFDFIVVIPVGQTVKLEGVEKIHYNKFSFWYMELDAGFPTAPDFSPSASLAIEEEVEDGEAHSDDQDAMIVETSAENGLSLGSFLNGVMPSFVPQATVALYTTPN
ncbi:hypothetical protein FB451DRAFT_40446 [Mycena latifolia]|nr:hypothetical protein FB451DRAFT_40446 [Mycena latifolia]